MKAIILERLHADHQRYAALLCILDRQLHIATCDEIPDYRLLARLCHYLTHQPEEWHHPVEDALFARLAGCDTQSTELLAVLSEEHRRITRNGKELEATFHRQASDAPQAELDLNRLNLALAFSELYRHHLYSEDRHVYPLIEHCIHADELDSLAPHLSLASPAEGSPGFQRLYRQIADHHIGLRLGHGEQADFCPLCDARPHYASL
ncbi:hemerythrin domain-containing protein [Halomonas sp. SSL-5]|uniref:hemerythrin domain-containing protein n=1 Tax=Halomonas sp. SSL-5 TaxID=3065855 RepID=UPI0027389DA1|nr:hemerythrin domain-containing protein [Halomonas sp. SSL-5]MDY7116342.1 hemerythrin domain-containing protein [Halomonas sp. SSL-5]